MASEKAPAYQRYPNDYLTDPNVVAMTLEEEGCYNRLMDYCWKEGSISTNLAELASMCKHIDVDRMRVIWRKLKRCFAPDPKGGSRVVHPRLEKERAKQREWAEKSRAGGLKSATTRRRKAKSRKESNHPLKGGATKGRRAGSGATALPLLRPRGNQCS